MKDLVNLKNLALYAMLTIFVISLASCDEEAGEQQPELPPVESLMMDFSDFTHAGAKGASKAMENTHVNWTYSFLTVGFWNTYATVVSALPVAAYIYALDQTPEYLGDQTWKWSYNFNFQNKAYQAVLTAVRMNNEEFGVDMKIILPAYPGVEDKWFDGVARYDQTEASWTIYRDGSIPALSIEWMKDFETEEAELSYTNVEDGAAEEGSFIKWMYQPGEAYDASYDISLAEGQVHINWKKESLEGRVQSLAYFGDDLWHCWDSQANNLVDKLCD